MPKLNIEVPHSLSREEAKRRLDALSSELASKYGFHADWVNDHEAHVKRTGVSGKITCGEKAVSIFLDLSFALTPMKGKIEERIRQQLQKTLA
jgi:putative polyhydroxyalkanoate system protein